jgi:hypothetical protein
MATPSANIEDLLRSTKLVVLPEDYFVVRLPLDSKAVLADWFRPATTRFAIIIREPQEINLIVNRRKWLRMQSIFPKFEVSEPMKVICFDPKLSAVALGYMAAIGAVLSDNRLSVTPISSFHRDHILVPKRDLPKAVKVFRKFLTSCTKEPPKRKRR